MLKRRLEQFNFDVTEIQHNGHKFIEKKGTVTTNKGIIINVDEFEYIKNLNILKAKATSK